MTWTNTALINNKEMDGKCKVNGNKKWSEMDINSVYKNIMNDLLNN